MLRYIASSKIKGKPFNLKYDFSIIVEKMENWICRTVHGPGMNISISVFNFCFQINNTQIDKYKMEKQNVIFDFNWKSNGRMTHGPTRQESKH